MKTQESCFMDLLLKGELEAVTQGLEDGLYSREELDQPHTAQGCTPLISACQMGLEVVMHFLLEKGADATLCNHSNQTALHVSQPDLQKELLAAMLRPLAHRTRLLEVAWRGDVQALRHLMIQRDNVDVNIRNQNGLTPLMLAVRDIDLFERFQDTIGWEYDPIQVVKTLLDQSANLDIQDYKSCTVLTHVSQSRSFLKDELLQIILNYQTQSVPSPKVPEFHFPKECCNNSHSLPPHMFSTLAKDAKEPYAYIALQEDHHNVHQDKIISLCFRSAMEPKMNSKLPGKSLVPIPPKLTEKTFSIFQTPALRRFSQLNQSVPHMDLLDASFLQQVQTNIHNRLSLGEASRPREAHPVPSPCTPKHLAPLDQEYRDRNILSIFQCQQAPKPTSLLSLDSREMGGTLSRIISKGAGGTGKGSEESSCSSQSSLDEEDEEEMFGRKPHFAIVPPSTMNCTIIEHINTNKPIPTKSKFLRHPKHGAETALNYAKEFSKTVGSLQRTLDTQQKSEALDVCKKNKTIYLGEIRKMNERVECELDKPKDSLTAFRPVPDVGQSSSFADSEQHYVTPVDISLRPDPVETSKTCEMATKRRSSYTKTINILDQKNKRLDYSKSKKNRSSQSSHVIIKEKELGNVISEENLDWSIMATTNHGPKLKDVPLNWRTLEPQVKQSGTKKASNKTQGQKQLFIRDPKKTARQSKRPGIVGTQRTKSSLDCVSYRDMFLELHQAAEGPAIFEMFATPIYENLRAGSSVGRPKQVQSAAQFKRQPSGQQKVQKPMEGSRRKQTSKGKPRKRKVIQHPERVSHSQATDLRQYDASGISRKADNNQIEKHQLTNGQEVERLDLDVRLQTEGSTVLSIIREVPSHTDIRPVFYQQQGDAPSLLQSHRPPYFSMRFIQGDIISNVTEDSIAVQLLSKPLINTWTTEGTKSPVYQRVSDKVGEGPVTDDLLKCLAEELISLEEREMESPKSLNAEMTNDSLSKFKFKDLISEGNPLHSLHCNERSSIDVVTWTKGEILGRGAYGTVYCGLTSQGKLIAVKQVTLDVSNSETAKEEYERLEREVDLLKNLHHQNIVGFLGTALSGHIISILMEYIPGGSISNVLKRFGPLSEKVFALYTRQILEGVAYLHNNHVIHRDLKGNNIMLMPSGVIKLIDFGCARRLNRLTRSGSHSDYLKSVHGTPYWMAPEVINETGHGKKSDIWSTGCTVFEMATGKPPLAHMGKMAALFYIGAQKGLMPSLPDEFSSEAKEFVKACLVK
ncbi:Mitogen-activated protein kinase kinase kinase 19 [Bagarius yarrelli]|uniref:Mitogen-activated protein kinase kinase kinase 19 n=1 Tax=Bagarius yarrelli TaxID=175774 RepID=A0A556U4I1_BAGYA|nr:Mitogen-activated protein kinase kinase kinase 19 [Bagarius yarrelli]